MLLGISVVILSCVVLVLSVGLMRVVKKNKQLQQQSNTRGENKHVQPPGWETYLRNYVFPHDVYVHARTLTRNEQQARMLVKAFKEFLYASGSSVYFHAHPVDERIITLWATFVTNTREYAVFCKNTYGDILHFDRNLPRNNKLLLNTYESAKKYNHNKTPHLFALRGNEFVETCYNKNRCVKRRNTNCLHHDYGMVIKPYKFYNHSTTITHKLLKKKDKV